MIDSEMKLWKCKHFRFFSGVCYLMNSLTCKCFALVVIALVFRATLLPTFSAYNVGTVVQNQTLSPSLTTIGSKSHRVKRFLEVPQIVWGLNNQKIAFARACLTARALNRTLLMPSLSASLFYKEIDLLQPISFDKVFQFERFNARCNGFVRLGRYSDVSNRTDVFEMQKGSGRRWTVERDLDQLVRFNNDPSYNGYEIIRLVGKNPFLWHDHWPVKDYARIFDCLAVVDEISKEADRVVSKIREVVGGREATNNPYVAVHMRIEKDWMIHCKKLEQRSNISEICSSKEEIMDRVANIVGLKTPIVVYLAVADTLLEDGSILSGWKEGLIPVEKKKLGVFGVYKKYPYLIQSAIDYEVCLRSDIFVGNSFSTFSSLVVLERTQKMMKMGSSRSCSMGVRWPSFAYNILGEARGPQRWATNMSDSSLRAISYGSNHISC